MTENQKLIGMLNDGLIEVEDLPPGFLHRPRKHRKPRPPSLAVALNRAKAKGMVLTVEPSGAMTFKNIDKAIDHQGNGAATNEWDEVYDDGAAKTAIRK